MEKVALENWLLFLEVNMELQTTHQFSRISFCRISCFGFMVFDWKGVWLCSPQPRIVPKDSTANSWRPIDPSLVFLDMAFGMLNVS